MYPQAPSSPGKSKHPRLILWGFWLSVIISLAVVFRRLVALIHPAQSAASQSASIDATFSSHALLTAMHIVPAAIFVLLAAAVLLRRKSSVLLERLFFLFGAVTGL